MILLYYFYVYQISMDSPTRRRKASERLRKYFLEHKDLTGERQFHIELPEAKDHKYNITGEVAF